jgi:hypothetical protein
MNKKTESNQSWTTGLNRSKRWIAVISLLAVTGTAIAWFGIRTTVADSVGIVVHKTPSCGCCNNWIAHLRDNGFEVSVVDVSSTQPTRERLGVPRRLGSCHTAQVGEYWVEGHVPADLVQRLITEQSGDIRGIAVPGMPMGSPGMEGPNPVTYDVLAYGSDGQVTIYATRHGRQSPQ